MNQKFREAHPETLEWIALDPTYMLGTFDPKMQKGWKNLRPFKHLQKDEDPYPLENEEEENLIPQAITHLDDNPSWNLLGTHL